MIAFGVGLLLERAAASDDVFFGLNIDSLALFPYFHSQGVYVMVKVKYTLAIWLK